MLEKLLLAVTITFSLNLFLNVRAPLRGDADATYKQNNEQTPAILVHMTKKTQP